MLSDWAAALHLLHWARSDCVLYRLCCSFVDSGLELIQYLILFLFCVIGMHCHEALILIAERVDIRACVCESRRDVTLGLQVHSCALLSSGTVKCWGCNQHGKVKT